MVLSSRAWMTENIRQRQTEVAKAIKRGTECRFLYCITMPSCQKNLLDIHPYHELYKRKEYEEPFFIIGLSENRAGAVEMVARMAAEVAAVTERPEEYKENFIRFRDSFLPDDLNEDNRSKKVRIEEGSMFREIRKE